MLLYYVVCVDIHDMIRYADDVEVSQGGVQRGPRASPVDRLHEGGLFPSRVGHEGRAE